jgi:hypothetical protein
MKYVNKIISIFSILVTICCIYIVNIPIEKKDIYYLSVFEIYKDELDEIGISGFINKYPYGYNNINIKNDDQNKYILINANILFNKSNTNKFRIRIPIEKNINNLYYGNNELIWERKPIEMLNYREKLLELRKHIHRDDVIRQFGEPDYIPGGYPIFLYTLNNNRRAKLNFIGDRLIILTEEILFENDIIQNIIFDK